MKAFHRCQIVSVYGRVSQFHNFPQDNRALPGARTCTEPAGEIRGGLHQLLSHCDVGPKITYESRNLKKNVTTEFLNGV